MECVGAMFCVLRVFVYFRERSPRESMAALACDPGHDLLLWESVSSRLLLDSVFLQAGGSYTSSAYPAVGVVHVRICPFPRSRRSTAMPESKYIPLTENTN